MLATFPLTAGVPGARLILDVVFFVVLVSLLVQGIALLPLVHRLGFQEPQPAWAPVAEALPLEGIEIDLIEVHVTQDLAVAGRRLGAADIPAGSIVTAIVRHETVIVPSGETPIEIGDILPITTQRDREALQRLTAWARGEPWPHR